MNKQALTTLIQHNFWANDRILAACDALTLEQFVGDVTPDPGWGTLRGILVHALDTEYGWRAVVTAHDEDIIMEAEDFADVAALRDRWTAEKMAWLAFIGQLTDAQLLGGYGDAPQDSPAIWQTIMHVLLHSTQHRSEAATFLTGYGHSPGEIDFGQFLKAQADASQ